MNFTNNYLGILRNVGIFREITDGAIAISTISISENPRIFSYSKPKVIYDKFFQEQELIEPDIKKIVDSLQAVRELGFEIVSLNIRRGWFKKQGVQYKIRKASLVTDNMSILNSIPPSHYIEYDRANKRIRMIGKNCRNLESGIIGITEWVEK